MRMRCRRKGKARPQSDAPEIQLPPKHNHTGQTRPAEAGTCPSPSAAAAMPLVLEVPIGGGGGQGEQSKREGSEPVVDLFDVLRVERVQNAEEGEQHGQDAEHDFSRSTWTHLLNLRRCCPQGQPEFTLAPGIKGEFRALCFLCQVQAKRQTRPRLCLMRNSELSTSRPDLARSAGSFESIFITTRSSSGEQYRPSLEGGRGLTLRL